MNRSHKIRIYPTTAQLAPLWQTVGAARFAYNWGLATWEQWYKDFKEGLEAERPSPFGLSNRWTRERPAWAADSARCAQDRTFRNLGGAFTKFWKGTAERPVFKKRGRTRDSFYITNDKAEIKGARIRLPKVGWVPLAEPPRFQEKITGYTVSTYGGRWWVSVQFELADSRSTPNDSVVGVHVGLKNPATASDGTSVAVPTSLEKLHKRLRLAQRRLSKKKFRSKNYHKALLRKQRAQQKINNIREDTAHKFTTAITKNHGTVVIETLSIESMLEKAPTTAVRRAFGQSLMREIHKQLEYKAFRLVKADRYFPSSKLCSSCGTKTEALPPSVRTYRCRCCGLKIDRDLNAALNLKHFGAGQALRACGGELPLALEAGSIEDT